MSNIQTGAERMPHDLSHLGFLAGQIGRLITISTTPVIAGDSFEMDAVGALRLSPLRRGLAIDSTVDIFTFYVPHRHVYGEQWIKFMKDGVNATPLPTVNTTGYIDHAAFLGTINPDTNKIPKHLFQGYLNIYNNYFKAPWRPDRTEANPNELNQDDARYGFRCCHLKNIWTAPLPPETELSRQMTTSTTSIDIMGLQAAYANLHTDQERDYFMQRYHDVISSFGGKPSHDADNRPLLVMSSNLWASGYDVDGTDQPSLSQCSRRVQQTYEHSLPRCFVPEHGTMPTLALARFLPTATKEMTGTEMPTAAVQRVIEVNKSITKSQSSVAFIVGAIISILFALWGVSGGCRAVMDAMNVMYNVKDTLPFWKKYLIAIFLA